MLHFIVLPVSEKKNVNTRKFDCKIQLLWFNYNNELNITKRRRRNKMVKISGTVWACSLERVLWCHMSKHDVTFSSISTSQLPVSHGQSLGHQP